MKTLITVLVLLVSQLSMATNNTLVKKKLIHWAEINHVVGASVSINNKSYYYGYSNKALLKKVNSNTVFGIGSITKLFVSVAILKLEEHNKLNINDKITKYFPQYPKPNNVSIKELMHMSAGFNDTKTNKKLVTPLEKINAAYHKYNKKNANKWLYSNVSYQLLGKLIEKVMHVPLQDAISTLITSPLHLKHTYFPNKVEARSLLEYQNGHSKTSDYGSEFSAGGLVSNTHDLYFFCGNCFLIKKYYLTNNIKS